VDLLELGTLQPEKHWYYKSKLRAVRGREYRETASQHRIIEIGAGSGYFSRAFAKRLKHSSVIAYDPNYEDTQIGERGGVIYTNQVTREDIASADVMLFLDVLEHVPSDVKFLETYVTSSKPGTRFIFTVPAFMSLWSGHDEFLGHYRRYRRPELVRAVENAGLTVKSSRYLFVSIFPAVWVIRKFRKRASSDMKPVPRPVDFILTLVLSLEHILPNSHLPGLTAICIAEKPGK
jgi:2-polyprenyl-3-methyl-5-hydroxy-6-metoxy-1,4-benzoquinol methylase